MAVEVKKYYLNPTTLVPNSPHPLLYYPGFLSQQYAGPSNAVAVHCHRLFESNDWRTQWVFRYGPTQISHYHSRVHECMAVLSGSATIRFGVADTVDDPVQSTHGMGREEGGVEITARAGDVFVIPAGVAHKTYDTAPQASFALLTPGDGHSLDVKDAKNTLANLELRGFTMIGAYPADGGEWDFAKGGEDGGNFERVWTVAKPARDPVMGEAEQGIKGSWL